MPNDQHQHESFLLPVVCLACRRCQPAGPVGRQPWHQPVSDAGGIDHHGGAVLAQLRGEDAAVRAGAEAAQAEFRSDPGPARRHRA